MLVYLCFMQRVMPTPDPYMRCQERLVGEKAHLYMLLFLVHLVEKTPQQHKMGCGTLEHPHCLYHL